MRLLQPSVTVPAESTPGSRRRLTLLSGFLGSGKTTLLRAELARADTRAPAVIVNDFGHTSVEEPAWTGMPEGPVVLTGGCACCTRREDLAAALTDLIDAEQRGTVPSFDHVVIETSGLSDPGPIAFTVTADAVLKHHYTVASVCVTVDALTGLASTERHGVAQRQLLAADHLLITKADLVDPGDVAHLAARLHQLNPSARVTATANGERLEVDLEPAENVQRTAPSTRTEDTHATAVSTLELVIAERVDWQSFATWLSLLLHVHGPDVLRVKGVLDVDGVGPVAVNGVQHVIHTPEHLSGAVPSGTRIVLIVRGLDTELLERSFHAFLGIGK